MRREPYGVGSIVHVVKRGARGLPFLKEEPDYHRLLLMLAHFNDKPSRQYWIQDLECEHKLRNFKRADTWGKKDPLVYIHAFCLQSNHFHLLLEEISEGGISSFMQKIGNGLAGYLNEKYSEIGSPFQGSYKSKTIDNDVYLRYAMAYIQTKNTFEQYPGGYTKAFKNFDSAYQWSIRCPNSSAHDHLERPDLSRTIVSDSLVPTLWTEKEYKKYAEDVIAGRAHIGTRDKKAFHGSFQ
jgi:REP element-mobilizing transposase RayT